MTGFALFQDTAEVDSFQCFDCDANFTCAHTAITHIRENHLIDDADEEIEEEMDQVNEFEWNNETEEDEFFVLEESVDPFGYMHQWMDSKSIPSQEYERWKKEFGHAECPFCSSVFRSKLAWIHHIIESHDIRPGNKSLCDSKQLIESAYSLKRVFDNVPGSSSGENIPVSTNGENVPVSTSSENVPVSSSGGNVHDSGFGSMNPINADKYDDISVSTSGEHLKDSGFDSLSQKTFDKYDDIPVPSNVQEVSDTDSDPPSPIIKARDPDRIQEDNDDDDEDFGWMIFPNGQWKKRKFPDPKYGPEITDQELEDDDEYQMLINECS